MSSKYWAEVEVSDKMTFLGPYDSKKEALAATAPTDTSSDLILWQEVDVEKIMERRVKITNDVLMSALNLDIYKYAVFEPTARIEGELLEQMRGVLKNFAPSLLRRVGSYSAEHKRFRALQAQKKARCKKYEEEQQKQMEEELRDGWRWVKDESLGGGYEK